MKLPDFSAPSAGTSARRLERNRSQAQDKHIFSAETARKMSLFPCPTRGTVLVNGYT
jgi:hypothetical protein